MSQNQNSRAEVEALKELVVLEFGAGWCGYCRAAQPDIEQALKQYPQVAHIKIEDGKGQRLGRSYLVKLWPTLILLKDGVEISRLVRPTNTVMIVEALTSLYSS
jgi:thioredoxin 1